MKKNDGLDHLRGPDETGYDDGLELRKNPAKSLHALAVWARMAPPQGSYAHWLVAVYDTLDQAIAAWRELYAELDALAIYVEKDGMRSCALCGAPPVEYFQRKKFEHSATCILTRLKPPEEG